MGTQAAVLIAVVANLHAVYLRLYEGRPLWNLAEEEVLAHDLPHTWPDGRALKKVLPPDARVGLRVWPKDEANGISEPFMLHSWAYPIALFDLYPKTENWREDATFSKAAEKYRLQYLLEYRQSDRTNPLRLEPLR